MRVVDEYGVSDSSGDVVAVIEFSGTIQRYVTKLMICFGIGAFKGWMHAGIRKSWEYP